VTTKDNIVEENNLLILYCNEPSLYYPVDFATTTVGKKIDIVLWNAYLL